MKSKSAHMSSVGLLYGLVYDSTLAHLFFLLTPPLPLPPGRREVTLVHYEAALGLDRQYTVTLVNTGTLMISLSHNAQAERLYKRFVYVCVSECSPWS